MPPTLLVAFALASRPSCLGLTGHPMLHIYWPLHYHLCSACAVSVELYAYPRWLNTWLSQSSDAHTSPCAAQLYIYFYLALPTGLL